MLIVILFRVDCSGDFPFLQNGGIEVGEEFEVRRFGFFFDFEEFLVQDVDEFETVVVLVCEESCFLKLWGQRGLEGKLSRIQFDVGIGAGGQFEILVEVGLEGGLGDGWAVGIVEINLLEVVGLETGKDLDVFQDIFFLKKLKKWLGKFLESLVEEP